MKRLIVSAAFVAMAFGMSARAEDTVETLKPQAVETCKKMMGDGSSNAEIDKMCGCMADNIVTVFGDDAVKMLKILAANLEPSDVAKIAKLLGISEDEAKAFITTADENMDKVMDACAAG